MYTICRQYACDAVHDASSVVIILTELAAADQNHNMRYAPAPNNINPRSLAHAVDMNVSYLNALVNAETYDKATTYGDTYASTSDSVSSAEKSHFRACHKDKKKEKSTSRQSTSRYQGRQGGLDENNKGKWTTVK